MPQDEIVLDPVDHITVDALGKPGQRVFYIQAIKGEENISLIIEKFQLQSLLEGTQEFFDEIYNRFPELESPEADLQTEEMHIQPPVDTIFRAGDMGLAYDENRDLTCIFAHEGMLSGESGRVVRFWCTRAQLVAVAQWGRIVLERGRPVCPQCRQPMESEGHFCPKKNGHKH
ncbi:MAG: DUF3090 family protein [Pelolinea sp.]|nr:DUF3090 family protein [Pelolinea sp.]